MYKSALQELLSESDGETAAAALGTNAQELLASPRPVALAALQAQADRHGLLREVLQRLRKDSMELSSLRPASGHRQGRAGVSRSRGGALQPVVAELVGARQTTATR